MTDIGDPEIETLEKRPTNTKRFNQTTITVVNNTGSALSRVDLGHNEGGFRSGPAKTIGPNSQITFGSREEFGKAEEGDDGFVIYDPVGDQKTFWNIQWINPETGSNRAVSDVQGDDKNLFAATGDIPEIGDDVAATFTLSEVEALTEDDFFREKPVEADEPTVRHGDQSVDGWVEYLQELLNAWGLGPLATHGTFDDATFQAVIAFQHHMNTEPGTPSTGRVMVDGIVGHQTWALLREEDPRPPSTDGLPPHSFIEVGAEARWLTEDSAFFFLPDEDRLVIQGVSTGDTPIESGSFNARFLIVLPNADTVVEDRPIFTETGEPAPPGGFLFAEFEGAAAKSREVEDPFGSRSFSFQAHMPAELGGDTTESSNVPFD